MSHPTDLNVYSMTGFGNAEVNSSACKLTLQLKSVNSRYLDLSFKIPEELATYEANIREAINQRVKRGKIECKIGWQSNATTTIAVMPNADALQAALNVQNAVLAVSPNAAPLSVAALLAWQGVMPSSVGATAALADVTAVDVDALLKSGLDAFLESRAFEGSHLTRTLLERLEAITAIVNMLREQLPELMRHQETKLAERLLKAFDAAKGDNTIATSAIPREELIERIRVESSATAIRIDVAEELDRLDGHIANTRKTLASGAGGIGKKLDFMMQEFNREANTLGSKSASLLQTQASVELKLIIEQMREQVQNIE